MTALSVSSPFPIFTDIDGQPLEAGYVWLGTVNLDPQVNPINVYWDAALTIAAVQPIRTIGGYPANSGTPARLYVNSDYSIRVMNKNGSVVYSAPAATELISASMVSYLPAGTGAVATTVQAKLREFKSRTDNILETEAVKSAFAAGATMRVKAGETFALPCNPSSGDNLQAMANWISSNHYIEQGGNLYLEIADGLHNVTTFIDVTNGRLLDIRATSSPDLIAITGATFTNDGEVGVPAGEVYTATITVASTLPDRVVAGFAVGGMNVQGDGGAHAVNGGLIVDTVAGNRLSFTTKIRSHGVVLVDVSVFDATPSLGLTPNILVIPKCTIRANEAGWDGAAREAFINALRGSQVNLTFVGISYNGILGDNDMLFARDAGSEIALLDYCVIAGAGEMVTRSFNYANILTNRSCLGGGTTGANIFQGSGGGTASFTRTMMGSVLGDAISSSSGCAVQIGLCVITGANQGLRPTVANSSIVVTSSRVTACANGAAVTKGTLSIDAASSIKFCTSPVSMAGGFLHGNPVISDNTNVAVASNVYDANGGAWYRLAAIIVDAGFYKVGRFTAVLNFPSIPGNSFADLTVAASGAAFNDFCIPVRSGSTEPAQGIVFRAFISAADVVTVRAYNITVVAIDPTAYTARVLVMRAT